MKLPDKAFWQRIVESKQKILALDYDGTLAPFRVERMEARPLPGTIEAIDDIIRQGSTRVAVVSGRTIAELDRLMEGLADRAVMIGSHGWEWRRPGERTRSRPLKKGLEQILDRAGEMAREAARDRRPKIDPGRIEIKPAGVAVHVRGLGEGADGWLETVRELWAPMQSEGLAILEFDGGIELRAAGRDKGSAVAELEAMFPGAELMVYIGDDLTDEDAFKALSNRGIGIKVGNDGPTSARYALPGPEEVRDLLTRWKAAVGHVPGEVMS